MTYRKAWEIAYMLFGSYEFDPYKSQNAGYRIYRSSEEDNNGWISDLESRLEINFSDGRSMNIWIVE